MTDPTLSESLACPDVVAGQGPAEQLSAAQPPDIPVEENSAKSSDGAAIAAEVQPFGSALEPVLRQACGDRLSAINWFRTDWQRGGAATGYATWRDDDGIEQPVVVKLPVQPRERLWLHRLQNCPEQVVPRLYAHGDVLNGYDIAWVIMQRLPHGPLGSAWGGAAFDLVVEAVGRFYKAVSAYPVDQPPVRRDWEKILDLAREKVRRNAVTQGQRWSKALKKAQQKLPQWLTIWRDRPVDQWCHGDLHLGNAMSLQPPPNGPAILLDLAEVHAGYWVEDAVYFEHLYWARRDLLDGRKICKAIAAERRRHGLDGDNNWSRFAEVRRALLAMSTPAILTTAGDPLHVQAALEVLEMHVG